jgi:hypothetical protein
MTIVNSSELTERELSQFLARLEERLDLVAEYESRLAQFEAPRFNLFASGFIDPDENKITDILADLLDPKGSHGQGALFCSSFLEAVGFDRALKSSIDGARVRTQHPTSRGRFIDLTVRLGKHILGLENKIDAGERNNQVADYIQYLATEHKADDWFFVFLTTDGHRPSTPTKDEWEAHASLPDRRVRALSYAEMSRWVTSCIPKCKSDRVRALLQDLASWTTDIQETKVEHMNKKVVMDFVLRNREHIGAALALSEAAQSIRHALIADFSKSLEEEMLKRLSKEYAGQPWSFTETISEHREEVEWHCSSLIKDGWPEGCSIGIEVYIAKDRADNGRVRKDDGRASLYLHWPGAGDRVKHKLTSALNALGLGKSSGNEKYKYIWCPRLQEYRGIELAHWTKSATLEAMCGERRDEIIDDLASRISRVARAASDVLEDYKQ